MHVVKSRTNGIAVKFKNVIGSRGAYNPLREHHYHNIHLHILDNAQYIETYDCFILFLLDIYSNRLEELQVQ